MLREGGSKKATNKRKGRERERLVGNGPKLEICIKAKRAQEMSGGTRIDARARVGGREGRRNNGEAARWAQLRGQQWQRVRVSERERQ